MPPVFLCYNENMKADYINPSVYNKIYHLMQYENALALRVSLETGLRIGDVLALTPGQLQGNCITYVAQKTGKSGKKYISADLSRRLRRVSDKNFIFPGRFDDKPRTRQTVWKDVKKAAKMLGIAENATCHSARKTYAVELFHNSGLPKVQKELQHDRVDTTMIYAFADMLGGSVGSRIDVDALAELIAQKVYEKIAHLFG